VFLLIQLIVADSCVYTFKNSVRLSRNMAGFQGGSINKTDSRALALGQGLKTILLNQQE